MTQRIPLLAALRSSGRVVMCFAQFLCISVVVVWWFSRGRAGLGAVWEPVLEGFLNTERCNGEAVPASTERPLQLGDVGTDTLSPASE